MNKHLFNKSDLGMVFSDTLPLKKISKEGSEWKEARRQSEQSVNMPKSLKTRGLIRMSENAEEEGERKKRAKKELRE